MTIENPLSADEPRSMHVHSRRAILGGATAIAAMAAGPTALAMASDSDRLSDLWSRWKATRSNLNDLSAAAEDATGKLPWWARSGPSHIGHDGTLSGSHTGWPAIEYPVPPSSPGMLRNIRPSPASLKRDYDLSIGGLWNNHPTQIANAKKRYRDGLRGIVARRRRRDAEEDRVGLTDLEAKIEAAYELRDNLADEIMELSPSLISVAAVILSSLGSGWDGENASDRVLKHIEAALAGDLAAEARSQIRAA